MSPVNVMRSVTTNKKVFHKIKESLKFFSTCRKVVDLDIMQQWNIAKRGKYVNLRNRYNTHSFIVFRHSTKEIKYKYKKKATIYKTKTELEEES